MNTTPLPVRQKKAHTPSELPLVKLSLAVEPLVHIISRHVKVSDKARHAIERDLADAFELAGVQLLTSISAPPAKHASAATESDSILSTEQAAQLVGVSRPYMVKLIESGAVELHQMVGNQRRVRRSAVLRWRANERARQAKALKRLAKDLDEELSTS